MVRESRPRNQELTLKFCSLLDWGDGSGVRTLPAVLETPAYQVQHLHLAAHNFLDPGDAMPLSGFAKHGKRIAHKDKHIKKYSLK